MLRCESPNITADGLRSLVQYVAEIDVDGMAFPDSVEASDLTGDTADDVDDDGYRIGRISWHWHFMRWLGQRLRALDHEELQPVPGMHRWFELAMKASAEGGELRTAAERDEARLLGERILARQIESARDLASHILVVTGGKAGNPIPADFYARKIKLLARAGSQYGQRRDDEEEEDEAA